MLRTGETMDSTRARWPVRSPAWRRRPAGAARVDHAGPSAPRSGVATRALDQLRRWIAAEPCRLVHGEGRSAAPALRSYPSILHRNRATPRSRASDLSHDSRSLADGLIQRQRTQQAAIDQRLEVS